MGKIDDMRRQREQQLVTGEGAVSMPSSTVADGDSGKCPDCGKTKALQNGLIAQHQKGLGKMCPGSRSEPV